MVKDLFFFYGNCQLPKLYQKSFIADRRLKSAVIKCSQSCHMAWTLVGHLTGMNSWLNTFGLEIQLGIFRKQSFLVFQNVCLLGQVTSLLNFFD